MNKARAGSADGTLDSQARVPQHVVFREFAEETVLLDIQSGRYYGLNRTAGRMLTAVNTHETVRDALTSLCKEFPDARAVIEADLLRLCRDLSKLGLVALRST
jgi:endonuclease III